MALTLISSQLDTDLNGISYGLIVWEGPPGQFHAKASRPPTRQDTALFATAAAAAATAKALATTMS